MVAQDSNAELIVFPGMDKENVLDLDDWELNRTANAVKAMAHPLRLKLLCLIGTCEISVQELTNRVHQTSQSNISQHLAHMLERGVLENRKQGNQVLYRIRDPRILSLIIAMRSVFCPHTH
jgi:DNA-binding transcriptional ArsR family regulator